MPATCRDRGGDALRIAATAALAAGTVLAGPEVALATTDTTFGDPLDTVQDIVGGTGGQLAAALAVGAALVGSVSIGFQYCPPPDRRAKLTPLEARRRLSR